MAKKAKESKSDELPLDVSRDAEREPPTSSSARREYVTKGERQEFFIPVSGFVWLYPEEVEVVNHPTFQRLGRIYQLGQTYVVYRGATHKRLEHVLGAVHMVQRMIDALSRTNERARLRGTPFAPDLSPHEERFIRLGALLHDIGHLAAGHTVEDELFLIAKHDHDSRLALLFNDAERRWIDSKGRNLQQLIDQEFSHYLPPSIFAEGISPSDVVRLLIRKHPDTNANDQFSRQYKVLASSTEIRLNICRDMIGNTICADLLDYIHRDWYHIGKPRPFDDRILQYMELRSRTPRQSLNGSEPQHSTTDAFVISLGNRPRVRTDAISSILELLESRYQLAEAVLFHRTKLSAAAMLDRALFALWADHPQDIESFLLPLSDEEMLAQCRQMAEKSTESKSASERERATIAAKLLGTLEKRQLMSSLCTFTFDDLPSDIRARIQQTYGKSDSQENLAPQNRARALRVLEEDFNLPVGSLAMYCPTREMNAKIAEVKIAVGEDIDRFCDYERHHSNELSGGHLDAQLHRFRRLWRVHFFIERQAKENLRSKNELVLKLLRDAVEKLVLGYLRPDETASQVGQALAISLTATESSPWFGQKVLETAAIAAYQQENASGFLYPTGIPSIRSYIAR